MACTLQTPHTLRLPACSSCLQWISVSTQQVRGAKKLSRNPMITVRLLQDVPKFGQKGSILPVTRGRMRNLWFPRKMAQYLPYKELKGIKVSDIMAERDITFRPNLEKKKEEVRGGIDLLTPEQSHSLLESLLPDSIEFARSTKTETDPALHGSITITDIAATLRTMVAADQGEVSRVVIKSEQISFLPDKKGEVIERIQRLGTYPFKITMKQGLILSRKIVVIRQASVVELKGTRLELNYS